MTEAHVEMLALLMGAIWTVLLMVLTFMVRRLDRMLVTMNGSVRSHGEELVEHRTQLASLARAIERCTVQMDNIGRQQVAMNATCQAFQPWRQKLMEDYDLIPKSAHPTHMARQTRKR